MPHEETLSPLNLRSYLWLVFVLLSATALGQEGNTRNNKLKFTGDFRFRLEHDWNAVRSYGAFQEDRSRARYRTRFGFKYSIDSLSVFGARLTTTNYRDQQGPHITLGQSSNEFAPIIFGLDKLFYQFSSRNFKGWLGKNTLLMKKNNELFWNDNVYPEGINIRYQIPLTANDNSSFMGVNAGHFIINSANTSFGNDSYFQYGQLELSMWKHKVMLFPSFYYFHDVNLLPDGASNHQLSYTIAHVGGWVNLTDQFQLGVDYYANQQNYKDKTFLSEKLRDQKEGIVLSAKFGDLKEKGHWLAHLYYTSMEKYAVVDYFAQNDWARWDYSGRGARGSRLTNFEGFELRLGYAFNKKYNLVMRLYDVEEILPRDVIKETGSRIRLDLNIGF